MSNTKISSEQIIDGVALAGNPTTTTQSAGNNTTRVATTAFVTTAVANLVDSAPAALNTLNEIAAAINDDANINTTLTNSIAAKLPLAGGNLTGNIVLTTSNTKLQLKSTGSGDSELYFATASNGRGIYLDQSDSNKLKIYDGSGKGTDGEVVFDNTGQVGIGTSSPSNSLSIAGSANTGMNIQAGTSHVAYLDFGDSGDTNFGGVNYNNDDDTLNLRAGNLNRLTINSSGNVGIGTAAPSADLHLYATEDDRPHLLLEGFKNHGTNDAPMFEFYTNDQTTGGINDDTAVGVIRFSGDEKDGGSKEIYAEIKAIAHDPGSGTSNRGNVAFDVQTAGTLTRCMTLDENRVGIGTTNPSAPLHIQTNTSETNDSVTGLMMTTLSTGTTTTNFGGAIQFQAERNNGVNQNTGLISSQADVNSGSDISSGLRFSTGTAGVLGEKWRLGYNGLSDMYSTTSTLRLRTGTTGTSGQVLSGFEGSSTISNGTQRFVIYANGNIQNANNSYGQLSDRTLKENIVDATGKLDDLKKVKVRNFNFIGDDLKQIGVVAQELETVFPALVETIKDIDANGEQLDTESKSVKYSVFVPMLIKAMQEQQTIIDDLKARIETLEG